MIIVNTTQEVLENSYRVPSAVMSTALTPDPLTTTDNSVSFNWIADSTRGRYYIRQFNIYINDNQFYGPMYPIYLSTATVYTVSPIYGADRYTVVINKTATSTLPPLLNAFEIYKEI
ncbi:putative LRR receptor-like serine/threonine-protein kinase [Capsicum galapagoense]